MGTEYKASKYYQEKISTARVFSKLEKEKDFETDRQNDRNTDRQRKRNSGMGKTKTDQSFIYCVLLNNFLKF